MFYLERISHIALWENDNPTASSKYILKAFFPKLQDVTGLFKMRMCLKIKIIIKKNEDMTGKSSDQLVPC